MFVGMRGPRGFALALVVRVALPVVVALLAIGTAVPAEAGTLPTGFQDSVVFSGLDHPTAVRFAADGRVFVAQKNGILKVFSSVAATTGTTFADLRSQVDDYWDRGLLGLALDPQFPTRPYVYVLYAYDAPLGQMAPVWNDACSDPTGNGCVISGRLSRLTASGNASVGEQPLINDWCQQYPSHSIGSLGFGADGYLYASGGDGASFNFADWGQHVGNLSPTATGQANVCGDPLNEGGALRSQDLRTPSDPTALNGAILRLDGDTGAGAPGNPYAGGDANAARIAAEGLRNPFRFTFRPGTNEVWIGDVGLGQLGGDRPRGDAYDVHELRVALLRRQRTTVRVPVARALPGAVRRRHWGSRGAVLHVRPQCSGRLRGNLPYRQRLVDHRARVRDPATTYPAPYNTALFFADHSRNCIWAMLQGTNGLPDPTNRRTFEAAASNPVDLQIGSDGNLYYADLEGGTIRRITWSVNRAPVAKASASPTSGAAPLTVQFDATGSTDPDGDPLTYSWDLNGDGTFGDSTSATPSFTYNQNGQFDVEAAGQRRPRRPRHRPRDDSRRQRRPHRHHDVAGGRHPVEGRRRHLLQRLGDGSDRRPAAAVGADLDAHLAPLSNGHQPLPHACPAELVRREHRELHLARPRIPRLSRAAAHRGRFAGAHQHR